MFGVHDTRTLRTAKTRIVSSVFEPGSVAGLAVVAIRGFGVVSGMRVECAGG